MSQIPLGYGNYGMQDESLLSAIPRLAAMGYQTLELTAANGWPSAPDRLNAVERATLAQTIADSGLTGPALMMADDPFAPGARPEVFLSRLAEICRLARDLNLAADARPIVTFTLGSLSQAWESCRDLVAEKAASMAHIAAEHGVAIALEPHVMGSFDTPEKASWLITAVDHPNLRLNCDISHFLAKGLDIPDALEQLIPLSIYAHVKDVEAAGTPPRFTLPGRGSYDFGDYFTRLAGLGYAGPVVVEVSAMVWKQPDYEPWTAAQFCFDALDTARNSARPL